MKKYYFNRIILSVIFSLLIAAAGNAQTYVTVYSDNFENYNPGQNLLVVGYEVWEGTARSRNDAG